MAEEKLYSITNPDDMRKRTFYQPGTNKYDALAGFLDRWEQLIYEIGIFEVAETNKKRARGLKKVYDETRGLDTKKFTAKEIKITSYKLSLSKLEKSVEFK